MRSHRTDLVSFVFGLIFLVISGWWLAARYVDINVPHLGWFAAGALIVLGLLGVASSLRGDRTAIEPGADEPTPTPAAYQAQPSEPVDRPDPEHHDID